MNSAARRALAVLVLAACAPAFPAPAPPLEDFARMPAIEGVAISADGRYLSFIAEAKGQHVLAVLDRVKGGPAKLIFAVKPTDDFDVQWCAWANTTRLLCGFIGSVTEEAPGSTSLTHLQIDKITYAITRLVGINADGSGMKVLVQNSYARFSQFQDRVLDWTPDEPDTVLIELDDDGDSYPSVFELDVNTGKLRPRMGANPPIRGFVSDGRGEIRLGSGYETGSTKISNYARLAGSKEWKLLGTVDAFEASDTLEPLAVVPGTNRAYAVAESNGKQALWQLDLEDRQPPKLVFEDAQGDVSGPILASSGRLLGVHYENDRPHAYYTDKRAKSVIDGSNQFLAETFNAIADVTPDEKIYVLRAHSDIDYGSYHLLDVGSGKGELVYLGTAYPELQKQPLGRMKTIEYAARDGTKIQGYLTVPAGAEEKNLPLIVMPHGGPTARDSWDFDFLRLFLASRGYAVLQMNFRGSSGFGWEWLHAAHQDWGGLTYDDVIDGARWAVSKGVADPKRMGIVGWSFGGYVAMLAATRNGDLFRCAASIAGVSDLIERKEDLRGFTNSRIAREQIGMDRQKLLADSPLRHADEVKMPMLLVHGADDWTVLPEHSKKMGAALKRANKPHELIMIPKGDHQLGWRSERIILLTALEKFLATNLGEIKP